MRSTDLTKVIFPVALRDIHFEEPLDEGTLKVPIKDWKAVVDVEHRRTFCVVSGDYRLVTNKEALEFGVKAFEQLFQSIKPVEFEIFNVITPSTRSFCHIDLIHKTYNVKVWQQEEYLPYVRVTNSYNRSKALNFDLGFVRKLCSNGVIFEKEAIEFKFHHTRALIGKEIDFSAQHDKLKKIEARFKTYTEKLAHAEVPGQLALPLMCKALNLHFDINSDNVKKKQPAEKQLGEFTQTALALISKYQKQLGDNAYAVFNAATEYASTPGENNRRVPMINSLQRRAGNWVEDFTQALDKNDFDIERDTVEQQAYFNRETIQAFDNSLFTS